MDETNQTGEPDRSLGVAVNLLALALELRSREIYQHCYRVAQLSVRLGVLLELPDPALEILRLGAVLHDIGKIGIPDAILFKMGPRDESELRIYRLHAVYGANLLTKVNGFKSVSEIIRYHHEQWDGNGYPEGLSGSQIPWLARICSVANGYDWAYSNGTWQLGVRQRQAVEAVQAEAGRAYDPQVVKILVSWFGSKLND